jgi:pyrroline-5-carboxylate reductase
VEIQQTVGVIGGNGQLGGAIARAWLRSRTLEPGQLWISSRSGNTAGFEAWDGIHFTTDNQRLVDACEVVVLSVPPDQAPAIGVEAEGRLLISVMAGVSADFLRRLTRTDRIVRAMSSPAADIGLAFSPWCAGSAVSGDDRRTVRSLLDACGRSDEVPDERQIDLFTALTGPVPGFVACFADCMVQYAVKRGIDPAIADRAIRQLFLASGTVLAASSEQPGDHVRDMIAYAGTTAAGLKVMLDSPLAEVIADGLDAAVERTGSIGPDDPAVDR